MIKRRGVDSVSYQVQRQESVKWAEACANCVGSGNKGRGHGQKMEADKASGWGCQNECGRIH